MVIQIFRLLILLVSILCVQQNLLADNLETAKSRYETGKQNYNVSTLEDALNLVKQIPTGKEYEYLKGTIGLCRLTDCDTAVSEEWNVGP